MKVYCSKVARNLNQRKAGQRVSERLGMQRYQSGSNDGIIEQILTQIRETVNYVWDVAGQHVIYKRQTLCELMNGGEIRQSIDNRNKSLELREYLPRLDRRKISEGIDPCKIPTKVSSRRDRTTLLSRSQYTPGQ
jgi:hypothetical protein